MENQYFDKKVYLIGAGPGDAGLMTVKGRELLAAADTVIYDALAGDGIMDFIPGTAKQIYVGKRSGFHSASQEEIKMCIRDRRSGISAWGRHLYGQ